jgi:hypothetical protein
LDIDHYTTLGGNYIYELVSSGKMGWPATPYFILFLFFNLFF